MKKRKVGTTSIITVVKKALLGDIFVLIVKAQSTGYKSMRPRRMKEGENSLDPALEDSNHQGKTI